MKNSRRISILLALLLVTAFVVTGCAGKPKLSEAVVGDWNSKEFTESMGMGELESVGITPPKDLFVRFTKDGLMQLMADGKPVVDYMKELLKNAGADDATMEQVTSMVPEFNYKVDGDKFTLTAFGDSQEMNAKLEGDKLTLSDGKVDMVFTKRK